MRKNAAKYHGSRNSRPKDVENTAAPTWDRDEYQRVDGGRRMVRAQKIHGPQWVRAFSRWSLRIEFFLMDEPGVVSLFVNLGSNREKPSVGGRHSRFYRFWTLANGGPPRRGETMDFNIFLDKCFWARIDDSLVDHTGKQKSENEIYSRIVDLEEVI